MTGDKRKPRLLPRDITASSAQKTGLIIDHLVDALAGDPSSSIRRALILVDIDEHPGTPPSAVMARLNLNKSALTRDIDWMFDHGCIIRQSSFTDARQINLTVYGYARKNLGYALEYFDLSHKRLKLFLEEYISLFGSHKPTLRDAKIVATIGEHGQTSRQAVLDNLYDGPLTTDSRAIAQLIENGTVTKDG